MNESNASPSALPEPFAELLDPLLAQVGQRREDIAFIFDGADSLEGYGKSEERETTYIVLFRDSTVLTVMLPREGDPPINAPTTGRMQ